MRLATRPWLGTVLSVAAAVLVTTYAVTAPAKPRKAQDIVPVSAGVQSGLAPVCQMYPDECHLNADGSVLRVFGRRIVPGATDRAVLRHFQTEIGSAEIANWETPQ